MKRARIPTIIGILVLIIGIAAGVFLVQSRQIFRLRASPEITPKNIRVSNITDNSYSVSWTTDKEATGFITWGESSVNLDRTVSSSDEDSSIHQATVFGLTPETSYFFLINSDGKVFDSEGIPWQVNTGPKLGVPSKSILISGSVLTPSGTPAQNVIVYASAGGSSSLSALTGTNGNWVIPISSARTQGLNSYVSIDEALTLVEISVQAGPLGIASAQIYPEAAKPSPDITLGQTHDFKSLPASEVIELPEASIDLPEVSTGSSGFMISEEDKETANAEVVTLDSVDEGEIVLSNEPEFFGEGPPGTQITITVESSHPQTETVEIDPNGDWNWSPPDNLEEGVHNITITWQDAQGILQSITRSFIVSAQEGPAFVSTPSATPTTTTTPTAVPTSASQTLTPTVTTTPSAATISATPTATKTPTPTKIATGPALPDAGVSTPTILISLFGFALILFGITLFSIPTENRKN